MRDLINLITLVESPGNLPNAQELEAFKSAIASKIKVLPADDATAKTLKEIEELLQHVNAGGRMGMIKGQLHAVNDPAVLAAQKRLAQYLASMEVTPEDRAELFSLWKSDRLVNIDKLLSKKQVTFEEIFTNYGKNAAITELVDDVMSASDLGQGKGEFGLNVLSKSVAKPGGLGDFTDGVKTGEDSKEEQKGKGDLIIKSGSKWRKIECKTTDGGAARFSDQEVRPAEGYEAASRELQRFVEGFKGTEMYQTVLPKGMAKGYGLNMRSAVELYDWFKKDKNGPIYLDMVEKVITLIFGGKTADKPRIAAIMKAFKAGNANEVIQQYAQASFGFYMSRKDDEGVLAINLPSKTVVFYSTVDDLTKQSLRFNADTIYLTAVDAARGAYPQMSVMKTTFGANAAAAAEKQAQKDATKAAKAAPIGAPAMDQTPSNAAQRKQLEDRVFAFVTNQANIKGIFDQAMIDEVSVQTMDMLVQGMPTDQIKKQVNALLTQKKAPPAQPQVQQPQQVQQPVQPVAESIRLGRQRRA